MSKGAILAREMLALKLTVKYFGYEQARSLAKALPIRRDTAAQFVELQSKPATHADLAADWMAHWCEELAVPVQFHRKMWEYGYVLQAVYESGFMRQGARGLGFGCGIEPLPSYFASHGIDVMMTDLPIEQAARAGWVKTRQHANSRDRSFYGHLVSQELFDRHVQLRHVDMNAIDATLRGYDFCWSSCALEHLGTIDKGLDFIVNSIDTLKPGGLAVHTTEFNFGDEDATVEKGATVLYQKRHLSAVARRLQTLGHTVAPISFDIGDLPLDKFIDVPPFTDNTLMQVRENWGEHPPTIKLTVAGFPCTSFGFVIRKKA